jgi:hypothetical protein
MGQEMKSCFRLFQRSNGIYFCENRQTGAQQSLHTKDEDEAVRLLNAKNEAQHDPGLALHIARAYLAAADPAIAKRTWRFVVEELIKTKRGENALRWNRAVKDKAWGKILDLPLGHQLQRRAIDESHCIGLNDFQRRNRIKCHCCFDWEHS